MIMDYYNDKLWKLGLMEKTGEDEAEVYRRISSPQVSTAHCLAILFWELHEFDEESQEQCTSPRKAP